MNFLQSLNSFLEDQQKTAEVLKFTNYNSFFVVYAPLSIQIHHAQLVIILA